MGTRYLYNGLLVLADDTGDVDLYGLALDECFSGDLLIAEEVKLCSVINDSNSASAGLYL